MIPRLKIFEPTILPMDKSGIPVSAARIVTTNSGAEVPKATTVRPITSSLIPRRLAIRAAESTSQTAPT
jgi:hypothetical protein